MNKEELIKKYGLEKPFKSFKEGKKKIVFVKTASGNIKTIHYGDTNYEDYTQHKDEKRRESFRARHKCDEAKDKTTARFWACTDLW